MPVARPRLLRRRDAVASAIVSFVCLANVATTAIVWTCLRPRVRESEDLASRAVQLSESCLNETRNNISNMLTYLAFRDTENAINTGVSEQSAQESPDDVVGVYGYGQTRSSKHRYIYRDDKLRDGRSQRVYLQKLPLEKP